MAKKSVICMAIATAFMTWAQSSYAAKISSFDLPNEDYETSEGSFENPTSTQAIYWGNKKTLTITSENITATAEENAIWLTTQSSANITGQGDVLLSAGSETSDQDVSTLLVDYSNFTAKGTNISIEAFANSSKAVNAVRTNIAGETGSSVIIGDENTESIILTASGNENSYGILNLGGKVDLAAKTIKITSSGHGIGNNATIEEIALKSDTTIKAGEVTINSKGFGLTNNESQMLIEANSLRINSSTGIHVGNNTQIEDPSTLETRASTIIKANDTIITSDSYGILAFSNGLVDISGNLTIDAPEALNVRDYSTTNINTDGKGIVKIKGNINFSTPGAEQHSGDIIDAFVNINLTGSDSYWTGAVVNEYPISQEGQDSTNVSGLNVTLQNGAQWNAVNYKAPSDPEGSTGLTLKPGELSHLVLNDGVINTEDANQTVAIGTLSGTGGTINAKAAKDDNGNLVSSKLSIGSVNGDGSKPAMTVNYTGITADDLANGAEDMKTLADQTIKVGEDGSGTQNAVAQTFNVEEGNIRGAMTSAYDADGNFTTKQAKNVKLTDYGALNAMTFVQWRNEINHLTKRLGDIRASEASIGAWARVYGGESQWSSNSEIEMDHTTIQVGGDYRINNHWIVGGAFSYTDSDADLVKGQAEGDSYSLAAYATYMADGGSYLDLIARYGYLDNELTSGNMDVDTESNAFSLSVETGHMFRIMEQAYIEPQIEVTYGFISGDDTTASNGVKLDQDDFQSLITRVGVRTGFDFPEKAGTFYAMLSYSYDFLGDADGTASQGDYREPLNQDLGGGWVTYGVGAQFKLGDSAFAYGELERTSGGEIDNPYLFNVGVRMVF